MPNAQPNLVGWYPSRVVADPHHAKETTMSQLPLALSITYHPSSDSDHDVHAFRPSHHSTPRFGLQYNILQSSEKKPDQQIDMKNAHSVCPYLLFQQTTNVPALLQ